MNLNIKEKYKSSSTKERAKNTKELLIDIIEMKLKDLENKQESGIENERESEIEGEIENGIEGEGKGN